MKNTADVIVAGLGAMGSAALYQLAKRGVKTLGIDRFTPPHNHGSTHGSSRITRQAIGEGMTYTPLALRSHEIWKEMEQETGRDLLTVTGALVVGAGDDRAARKKNFLQTTIDAAKQFDIPHTVLDEQDLAKRFPQFRFKPGEHGCYEHNAGFLRTELCVEANLQLAGKHGADLHFEERIIKFEARSDGTVSVATDKGVYTTQKLIVSAGPWVAEPFPQYAKYFSISREVMYWFDIEGPIEPYQPDRFPVFIYSPLVYGFPAMDGPRGGLKIAAESFAILKTPEQADTVVSAEETTKMYGTYAHPLLPALRPHCVKAVACLYTTTPDSDFVVDFLPGAPQIIMASPCSGHGFKHSAAIGEILADLAQKRKTETNIDAFKLSRFAV